MSKRQEYNFIQLNLLTEKHKALIEWIKKGAEENEQSLSAFCIKALKDHMEAEKKDA